MRVGSIVSNIWTNDSSLYLITEINEYTILVKSIDDLITYHTTMNSLQIVTDIFCEP